MDGLLIDKLTCEKIREYVPDLETVRNLTDFFAALSDETRLRIVTALSVSKMCVSDLTAVLSLNQTTVSRQLKTLRIAGIVDYIKQGKVTFYFIKDERFYDLMSDVVKVAL